jgi:hypothetical protein
MRPFSIGKAKIDPDLRTTYEQYGVATMQTLLALGDYFRHKGKPLPVKEAEESLLCWLTEQYDRAERKEHWTLLMEAAITLFVAAELFLSLFRLFCGRSISE